MEDGVKKYSSFINVTCHERLIQNFAPINYENDANKKKGKKN